MQDGILSFALNGAQVTIDLRPFTEFNSMGRNQAMAEANKVYLQVLEWYPLVTQQVALMEHRLYEQYKASGVKGPSGRQSKEHFQSTVMVNEPEWLELSVVATQLKHLVREGLPTVLGPNMRIGTEGASQGEYAYQKTQPAEAPVGASPGATPNYGGVEPLDTAPPTTAVGPCGR